MAITKKAKEEAKEISLKHRENLQGQWVAATEAAAGLPHTFVGEEGVYYVGEGNLFARIHESHCL